MVPFIALLSQVTMARQPQAPVISQAARDSPKTLVSTSSFQTNVWPWLTVENSQPACLSKSIPSPGLRKGAASFTAHQSVSKALHSKIAHLRWLRVLSPSCWLFGVDVPEVVQHTSTSMSFCNSLCRGGSVSENVSASSSMLGAPGALGQCLIYLCIPWACLSEGPQ